MWVYILYLHIYCYRYIYSHQSTDTPDMHIFFILIFLYLMVYQTTLIIQFQIHPCRRTMALLSNSYLGIRVFMPFTKVWKRKWTLLRAWSSNKTPQFSTLATTPWRLPLHTRIFHLYQERYFFGTHTHTHTHIYKYIYICVCVCVCVWK